MKKNLKGEIVCIEKICEDTFEIKIKSDLEKINAGQFFSILCPPKILRRPFGVASFKNGVLGGMFKLRGEGTKYLSSLKVGDFVEFNAPLGVGFNVEKRRSLLVGAGIGVAPLFYLRDKLNEIGAQNLIITGVKSEAEIIKGADYTRVGGTILDDVEKYIEEFKPEKIYACAPEIVLKLLSKMAIGHNIDCEIAMEKVMACGMGVCRGCVIKIERDGIVQNATICHDGPVFKGCEVIWG